MTLKEESKENKREVQNMLQKNLMTKYKVVIEEISDSNA